MQASASCVLDAVLDTDTERRRLLQQEKRLLQQQVPSTAASNGKEEKDDSSSPAADDAGVQLSAVYDALAAIDADGAEARAVSVLEELGFRPAWHSRPTRELSGGWRMRLALACALYQQPDVLLLDEPTNHLDLVSILWLTRFLTEAIDPSAIVLLVSHDRVFLSAVSTDTVHFHRCQLHYHAGNLDSFLRIRSESEANLRRQQEALDSQREHIRQSIDKMKAAARSKGHPEQRLGLVGSRQKKLGRMGMEKTADGKKFNAQSHGRRLGSENDSGFQSGAGSERGRRIPISLLEPLDKDFKFVFPQPDWTELTGGFAAADGEAPPDALLLTLKDVGFSFTEPTAASPPLFARLNLAVRAGEKIAILGANGVGKSALLGLMACALQPTSGAVLTASKARVGYFRQQLVDMLDMRLTPLQHLQAAAPHLGSEHDVRAALGRFGLGGSLALKPIGVLSGGQKARLVFAAVTCRQPHLLLLDEPSNHLDMLSVAAMVEAVDAFTGAVVVVSHEQTVLERCQRLWLVERPSKRERAGRQTAAKAATATRPPSRSTLRQLTESLEEYRDRLLDG